MSNYSHAYTFGFELISQDDVGEDVTPRQLREAIVSTLARLDDDELLENCGDPFDTYEIMESDS